LRGKIYTRQRKRKKEKNENDENQLQEAAKQGEEWEKGEMKKAQN